MLSTLRYLFALSFVTANLATAHADSENLEQKKMSQAIYKAYSEAMEQQFLQMANLSKSSKNQSEFFQKIWPGPKDKDLIAKLDKKWGNAQVPKISTIKGGIEFVSDGKTTNITLTPKLGVLLIDGQETDSPFAQNQSRLGDKFSIVMDLWIPRAYAGPLDYLFKFVVDVEHAKTFKEAFSAGAKQTAFLTGIAAASGCALGISANAMFSDDQAVEACKFIAQPAAASGVFVGLVISFVGPISKLGSKVVSVSKIKPFAMVPGVSQGIKDLTIAPIIGTLGSGAVLFKSFSPQIYKDGGRLRCFGKDGNFNYGSISQDTVAYRVRESCVEPYEDNCISLPLNSEQISKQIRKFDGMPPESQRVLLADVMEDLESKVKTCKKHGNGYTEKYYFPENSTTKAIEAGAVK